MKVLIVGSGGREHAIAWSVSQSKRVDKIYCAPGNGGIAEIAECVNITAMEFDKLAAFAKENEIDLTIIGMDDPLVGGIVDVFEAQGLRVFGPRKNAAIIEGSKSFSKDLMKKYNIPTCHYETFHSPEEALIYLENVTFPVVLKADGLALGKGVLICQNLQEAEAGVTSLMLDKQLAFSEFLGINVIIVLNKIDLDDEKQFEKIEKIYKKIGYKVIETEAKKQKGIEKLQEQLKNNISAFSGNSGVGKSTLINGIFKRDITQEGEISKRNKRGKNTTTAIKLYEINENTYIADTPGFSTFDISEIPSQELENYFVEFEREKEKCEFIGCTHIKEKNCGVKQAIEEGKISKERYNRFCKIYEELKQKEERKKW